MFCTKCGKQAEEGTLFCTQCGTKILSVEEAKAASAAVSGTKEIKPVENTTNGTATDTSSNVTANYVTGYSSAGNTGTPTNATPGNDGSGNPKRNGLMIFLVALATFIVLGTATAIGGYFFFKADSSSKYEDYDDEEDDSKDKKRKHDDEEETDEDADDRKSSKDKDDEDETVEDSSDAAPSAYASADEAIMDMKSGLSFIDGTILQKYVKAKGYEMEYTFDSNPEGHLSFRIEDYDGDGEKELLVVDVLSTGKVELNMYDYSMEKNDFGVSTYVAGNYDIRDAGQLDIFTYELNNQRIIGIYNYYVVFMSADGVVMDTTFLEYLGDGFVEKDSVHYSGSDGMPDDRYDAVCSDYGIFIDWNELFDGKCSITKYVPNGAGNMIARIYQPYSRNIYWDVNEDYSVEFDKTYLGGYVSGPSEEFAELHSLEGQAKTDFVIPESDSRYLTEADLMEFSKEELRIARNEILARHGRRFKDNELQAYFDSKPWYTGYIEANDFNENILNEYESANMYFIKAFENDYDKYH